VFCGKYRLAGAPGTLIAALSSELVFKGLADGLNPLHEKQSQRCAPAFSPVIAAAVGAAPREQK